MRMLILNNDEAEDLEDYLESKREPELEPLSPTATGVLGIVISVIGVLIAIAGFSRTE